MKNPREQATIQLARKLHARTRSLRGTAVALNARGLRTRVGGEWTHGQVRDQLIR